MNIILLVTSFMLKCISTCFWREANGYVLAHIRRKVVRKIESVVDKVEQEDLVNDFELLQLA
jgi:hypothetical protein